MARPTQYRPPSRAPQMPFVAIGGFWKSVVRSASVSCGKHERCGRQTPQVRAMTTLSVSASCLCHWDCVSLNGARRCVKWTTLHPRAEPRRKAQTILDDNCQLQDRHMCFEDSKVKHRYVFHGSRTGRRAGDCPGQRSAPSAEDRPQVRLRLNAW